MRLRGQVQFKKMDNGWWIMAGRRDSQSRFTCLFSKFLCHSVEMAQEKQHSPDYAPKRRARDPFWDSRVHALVCALFTLINLLPAKVARWLGRTLGYVAWSIDVKHRRQVLRHMDIAFRNEKTREEKKKLCLNYYRHMGLSVIEFARLEKFTTANIDSIADVSALTTFDRLLSKGKGLICIPAHHGNWELCGYAVALKGYVFKSVVRPMDNPLLDTLITSIRERSGQVLIKKWKVLWKLKKLLNQGQIVTIAVDQNGGVGGLFVPCFGVLASTITSPAELHLATGAPIIVATLNRQPDRVRHILHVWDIIEPARTDDHDRDVAVIMTRINAAVEHAVRAYPEQWLWAHKRWKTRPVGEISGLDGLPPIIYNLSTSL